MFKNYHNNDTNVWVYKLDYEILKIANKIVKIPLYVVIKTTSLEISDKSCESIHGRVR